MCVFVRARQQFLNGVIRTVLVYAHTSAFQKGFSSQAAALWPEDFFHTGPGSHPVLTIMYNQPMHG